MVAALVIGGIIAFVIIVVAMGAWLLIDSLWTVAREVFGVDLDLVDGHGRPIDRV